MAGSRTGTPTVIKLVRRICRIVNTLGVADLTAKTSTGYAAAVTALVAACTAFEALDDYPAEIDTSSPYGHEDLIDGFPPA